MASRSPKDDLLTVQVLMRLWREMAYDTQHRRDGLSAWCKWNLIDSQVRLERLWHTRI